MRCLILLAVACGSSTKEPPQETPGPAEVVLERLDPSKFAGTRTQVRVDERIELLSLVFRLAGAPEYNLAPATPYVRAADEKFKPFSGHPAIVRTRELRKTGISYDAPIHLAAHLDANFQLFGLAELQQIEKRWVGVDVAEYVKQLREFRTAINFGSFLHYDHVDYKKQVEAAFEAIVKRENAGAWFDGLFGQRDLKTDFVVVPALFAGSRNFGTRVTLHDGRHELIQVLGIMAPDGMPRADEQTTSLLVHEMAHSYINPVFEKHHDRLRASGEHLFALVRPQMEAQAYGDWRIMLNEAGVRAVTTLYMREKHGADAGARAARGEQRLGFVWTNELTEVFRRLRGAKQTLEQYMPQVITFFDVLAINYRHGLPKLAFLGPVNAAMHEPVIVAPAGPLGDYATKLRDLLFKSSQVVAPTDKTLVEHPERHLLAYGSPATNAVVANTLAHARITVAPEGIKLGSKQFTGKDLVLVFTRFRHDAPSRGVVVYTAHDDRLLVGINGLQHGDRDWLVARRGPKSFALVEAGDFPRAVDGAWQLP